MKNSIEIFKAFIPTMVVGILFIFTAKFTLSKISDLNLQIQKETKSQQTLNQKYKLLSTVADAVGNDASSATLALPVSNPALTVISQLKMLATGNSLKIIDMKAGGEVKDNNGLLRADITFEVDGSKDSIFVFINSVSKLAPIMIVDKVKVSEVNGATRADITIKSFWANLPKSLPSLSGEISDLSEAELNTLKYVETLTPPTFVVSNSSEGVNERTDPFTQ